MLGQIDSIFRVALHWLINQTSPPAFCTQTSNQLRRRHPPTDIENAHAHVQALPSRAPAACPPQPWTEHQPLRARAGLLPCCCARGPRAEHSCADVSRAANIGVQGVLPSRYHLPTFDPMTAPTGPPCQAPADQSLCLVDRARDLRLNTTGAPPLSNRRPPAPPSREVMRLPHTLVSVPRRAQRRKYEVGGAS